MLCCTGGLSKAQGGRPLLPATLNLDIYQEDTYTRDIQIQDGDGSAVDITGWTFAAQIRRSPGGPLEADFAVDVTDAQQGEITLSLASDTTQALSTNGRHVWDFQATHADGTVRTYLQGHVTVRPDVTRVD